MSIDPAEAGASSYGGAAGSTDLGVNPLDGGTPEIGVDTGFEFHADNGFEIGDGYEHIESQHEKGVAL